VKFWTWKEVEELLEASSDATEAYENIQHEEGVAGYDSFDSWTKSNLATIVGVFAPLIGCQQMSDLGAQEDAFMAYRRSVAETPAEWAELLEQDKISEHSDAIDRIAFRYAATERCHKTFEGPHGGGIRCYCNE